MKDAQEEDTKRHSIGFVVSGKKKDEARLLVEADGKEKELADKLKEQSARVVDIERKTVKQRFKSDIVISTRICYECNSPRHAEDVMWALSGFNPDSVRQAFREAAEEGGLFDQEKEKFNKMINKYFNPRDTSEQQRSPSVLLSFQTSPLSCSTSSIT